MENGKGMSIDGPAVHPKLDVKVMCGIYSQAHRIQCYSTGDGWVKCYIRYWQVGY